MIKGYYSIFKENPHINKLLRILFSNAQAVQKKVVTTIPTADTLGEKEICWYKSAGVIRLYIKVEGTVAYVEFTNA